MGLNFNKRFVDPYTVYGSIKLKKKKEKSTIVGTVHINSSRCPLIEWRLVLILASSPTLFSRYKHVTRVFKYSGCGINTWLLILATNMHHSSELLKERINNRNRLKGFKVGPNIGSG